MTSQRVLSVAFGGSAIAALAAATMVGGAARAVAPSVTDTAASTGVYQLNESWTYDVADINSDGSPDLFLGGHDRGGTVLLNDGDGTFSRPAATLTAFPKRTSKYVDRHGCAWDDINLDGRVDAYCTVGRTEQNWVKGTDYDNELWLQQTDGSFVDVGTQRGVGDPYGRGRDAIVFDVNNDRRLDIYVMNAGPRSTDPNPELTVNKLFVQMTDGTFRSAPEYNLNQSFGFGNCGEARDWDGDGDQDLFDCGTNLLYYLRNDSGVFNVVPTNVSGLGRKYSDYDMVDFDKDGDLDIVGVRSGEVGYHLNKGNGTFASTVIITKISSITAEAVADADGNGWLDIYVATGTTTTNPADVLLLNFGPGQPWQRVTMPSAAGSGSEVEAITVSPGELPRFVVGNGNHNLLGPVQVLSLQP